MSGSSTRLEMTNTMLPVTKPFYPVTNVTGRTVSNDAYMVLARFYSRLGSGRSSRSRLLFAVTSIAFIKVSIILTSLCPLGSCPFTTYMNMSIISRPSARSIAVALEPA